jgi:hypothetical protein
MDVSRRGASLPWMTATRFRYDSSCSMHKERECSA